MDKPDSATAQAPAKPSDAKDDKVAKAAEEEAGADAPQVIVIQGGGAVGVVQVQAGGGNGNVQVKVVVNGQVVVQQGDPGPAPDEVEKALKGDDSAPPGPANAPRAGVIAPKTAPLVKLKLGPDAAPADATVQPVKHPVVADRPANKAVAAFPAADAKPADAKADDTSGVSSVYFHVDRDIGARLRKAAQLVAQKRLDAAFDLYLYVLETDADGLFQLDDNRYLGVRDHCLRSIAAMPRELLAEYRMRVDGDVARQFDSAKSKPDAEDIETLGTKHFLATAGPEILDYAGDVYAGRGDWGRAVSCWQRVLRWSDADLAGREMIETKAALGLGRMGQAREAREALASIRSKSPDATAVLGGKTQRLAEFLDAELPRSAGGPAAAGIGRAHWPQFGGDAAHGARMNDVFSCDVKVADLTVPGGDRKAQPGPQYYGPMAKPSNPNSVACPYMPVYSGGRVFLHDDMGVMAFRLGAISAEWVAGEMGGTPKRAPKNNQAMMAMGVPPTAAEPRTYCCAAADGVVYASLNGAPSGTPEVWAVSERGKVLWRATKDRVGHEWLNDIDELGDPVVFEGRLYLLAWGDDQFRRECHLICLDGADGGVKWRKFLCSGVRMRSMYGMYGMGRSFPGLTLPAVEEGVVVVCSNVGGIVGVDARSGEVMWGFGYDQNVVNPMTMMMMVNPDGTRRGLPPASIDGTPRVRGGVAYVMPTDSDRIYALDAATGRMVWRVGRGEDQQMIGLAGDALLCSGKTVEALALSDGTRRWKFDKDEIDGAGAGFVTGDSVYVPGLKSIVRLDPSTGNLLGRINVSRAESEYGNLLLVEDTMVQVGKKAHFYGLWDRVYAGIETDILRDPKDSEPHRKLGDLYARKDDSARAIGAYERSLSLMTGVDDEARGRCRAEVRLRLYGLFSLETKRAIEAGKTDVALSDADRSLLYAAGDAQRTESVQRVVDVHERRGEWSDVVKGWQSLVEDPPKAAYSFDGSSSMMPALYAELKIREVVKEHGATAYAEFEAQAQRLAAKGTKADLERVLARYPNSASSRRAMLRLGEIEAANGDFRKASRCLGDYLRVSGSDAPDATQVRWRLAFYQERDGQFPAARRTLMRLAKDAPDAMVGQGEDRKPLKEVVEAKLAGKEYAAGARELDAALFSVPLKERIRLPLGGVGIVARRGDALIMVDPMGKLRCVDGNSGKMLWSVGLPPNGANVCLAKGDRALVAGQGYVKAIDAERGTVLWTVTPGAAKPDAPNNFPFDVNGSSFSGGDMNDEVVALTIVGQAPSVVVLDARTGKVLWKTGLAGHPTWAPMIVEDRIVVSTNMGFAVYEAASGRRILNVNNNRQQASPVLLDGDRLLVCEVGKVVCYDLVKGEALWSVNVQGYNTNPLHMTRLMNVGGRLCYITPTSDRRIICIDTEAGRTLWSQTVAGNGEQICGAVGEGDMVFAFTARQQDNIRTSRVIAIDAKTGRQAWASPGLEGAWPRDWAAGKDYVAVLGEVWKLQRLGDAMAQQMAAPVVYVLDRSTGQLAQTLTVGGSDPNNFNSRPFRIDAVDENLWTMFYDKLVAYRAAK